MMETCRCCCRDLLALKIWQSVQDNGFSSVVAMFSSTATIVVPGRRVRVV